LPTAPDFVLEQQPQRLNQLELHVLGQAADIVMALDRGRRAHDGHALDHVRVQRALGEKIKAAQFHRRAGRRRR
jgi:hypothetical protein